jgi:hypothetical protein
VEMSGQGLCGLTSRLSGRAHAFATHHERRIAQRAHGVSLLGVTGHSKRWLGAPMHAELM